MFERYFIKPESQNMCKCPDPQVQKNKRKCFYYICRISQWVYTLKCFVFKMKSSGWRTIGIIVILHLGFKMIHGVFRRCRHYTGTGGSRLKCQDPKWPNPLHTNLPEHWLVCCFYYHLPLCHLSASDCKILLSISIVRLQWDMDEAILWA